MGIEEEFLGLWMELVPGCQVSAGIESLGGEDSEGNLGALGDVFTWWGELELSH